VSLWARRGAPAASFGEAERAGAGGRPKSGFRVPD